MSRKSLDACPERFRPALRACLAGELSPGMALTRLLMEAGDAGEVEAVLAAVSADIGEGGRLGELRDLARRHPQAFAAVNGVLRTVSHDGSPAADPASVIARWAAQFDRAAAVSPEASVALYSLGDPARLAAATDEVVAAMEARGLLGPSRTLIEIGCGIGRFQLALAPKVAACIGIDISPVMVETARRRCSGLANVAVRLSSGRDLAGFGDAAADCLFAVDSFPYIVGAGLDLAATHLREAVRVLKAGGDLLILNFSYRGDPAADRDDFARLAGEAGLHVVASGEQPFRLWDGTLFQARA